MNSNICSAATSTNNNSSIVQNDKRKIIIVSGIKITVRNTLFEIIKKNYNIPFDKIIELFNEKIPSLATIRIFRKHLSSLKNLEFLKINLNYLLKINKIFIEGENYRVNEYFKKLENFKEERNEQFKLVEEKIIKSKKNIIIVKAEEKSGKRIIKEIIRCMKPDYDCIYFTSLVRKDMKPQLTELKEEYNIETKFTKNDKDFIREIEKLKNKTYLFFDECDYGTDKNSKMKDIWPTIKKTIQEKQNIICILFSATPFEAEIGLNNNDEYEKIIFKPNESYCGSEWYIDNELINTPSDFFKNLNKIKDDKVTLDNINQQECLNDFNQEKNIGVVRINNKDLSILNKIKKKIILDFEDKKIMLKIIDTKKPYNWTDENSYLEINNNIYYLFIICRTCTRSTEIHNNLKKKIAFWHDNRNIKTSTLATLSQANGRVKGYDFDNLGIKINLYIEEDIFNENIEYLNLNLSRRVKKNGKKFIIEKQLFDTEEQAKEARLKYQQKHGNNTTYKKDIKDEKVNFEDAELEAKKDTNITQEKSRIYIYYEDINDDNTKKYVLFYRVSNINFDAKNSIYKGG